MIRGTKRPMPPTAAQTLDFRASIHNRFDIEVRDAATGELKQKAQAFNVICDALWDKLLNSYEGGWRPLPYFSCVLYGSGSGTPASSDTALFAQIAAIQLDDDDFTVTVERENSIASCRTAVTIQAEEAVGETITEVGIGYDTTHIVTHALLQDMNGNPISIQKTDADVIKIYATIFLHWPAAAWYAGAVNLPDTSNGTYFYKVIFGVDVNPWETSYNEVFYLRGAAESVGFLSDYNSSREFLTTVDKATKRIAASFRFPATSYNYPIRFIGVGAFHNGKYSTYVQGNGLTILFGSWYTPPQITGEAVGTGDGTTTNFVTAFPVRSGATVKVNGSVASGVSVRTGAPDGTQLHKWINPVTGLNSAGNVLYSASAVRYSDYYYPYITETTPSVFENPFFSSGIATLSLWNYSGSGIFNVSVDASDDFENWDNVGTLSWTGSSQQTKTLSVPSALQNKRFFKLTLVGLSSNNFRVTASIPGDAPEYNVHFDAPPAAGAVITCDYVPDCIAKDENHVFDLTLELTLSEYSEG